MKSVGRLSRGFVYVVSRPGVTGVRADVPEGLGELVARVKEGVGPASRRGRFRHLDARSRSSAVARLADGVVVGSAVVLAMESARRRRERTRSPPRRRS